MAARQNLTAREGAEQATLFNWAACQGGFKYPELRLMFHIPNGGKRSASEAGRFRAEGVKAGVPDIFLPVARCGYHGVFIEMKRVEGGRMTENQKQWQKDLLAQGYLAVTCYGWQAAADILSDYMEGKLK